MPGYISRLHEFSLWDTVYNPVGHLEVSSHRLVHTIAFSFFFSPKDSYFIVLVKRDGRVGDNETTVRVYISGEGGSEDTWSWRLARF